MFTVTYNMTHFWCHIRRKLVTEDEIIVSLFL